MVSPQGSGTFQKRWQKECRIPRTGKHVVKFSLLDEIWLLYSRPHCRGVPGAQEQANKVSPQSCRQHQLDEVGYNKAKQNKANQNETERGHEGCREISWE